MKILQNTKIIYTLLILCFALGAFFRFYNTSHLPSGLNTDETAIGYNAYSILTTGKDEYGYSFPLYFKSFNDYKLPVYIYLTSASIKFFGMTEFAVRFWSILMGSITIVSLFFLVKELSGKKDLALVSSFLIACNPWHIFFSRIAFEVNVAISFIVLGALLFILGMKRKNIFIFFLSFIFFLLSLYCYNVTRILSPFILGLLVALNYKQVLKLPLIFKLSFLLFLAGLTPFLLSLYASSGFANQQGVLISGGKSLASDIEFRSYLTALPSPISKLLFNIPTLILWQYVKNILSFFSMNFFFVNGAQQPINSVENAGLFNIIEALTIPLGIYVIIKNKISSLYPFVGWAIIVILIGSLTLEVPHATRTYGIIIPFVVFSAVGLTTLIRQLHTLKPPMVKLASYTVLAALFLFSFIYFGASYVYKFPIAYAKEWRAEDKQLVQFIKENGNQYDKIIFDKQADFIYTSLLFYGRYSPQDYHKTAEYGKNGLLLVATKFGKYQFEDIDWDNVGNTGKTLLITDGNHVPQHMTLLKTITLPTRPVVVSYDNGIGQYPVTDVRYKIYSSVSK